MTLFGVPGGANIEMVHVPAGTFTMGRREDGDDALYAGPDELPRHDVALSSYLIGKYEITNAQYAAVLNWALREGRLENAEGHPYAGGDVCTKGKILLRVASQYCQISHSGETFAMESRDGYSMASHPVVEVSWYGSVAFCDWLSEIEGSPAAHDPDTWELIDTDQETSGTQFAKGYRLPTEAEWERAAAWDGAKHWVYGIKSDQLKGRERCNFARINPLNLSATPHTAPVGWFDGVSVSPNGSVQTQDSSSPVGCYDMSGNVWEWCRDWYAPYPTAKQSNPIGPREGVERLLRGGGYSNDRQYCRSATRSKKDLSESMFSLGFRVARSD